MFSECDEDIITRHVTSNLLNFTKQYGFTALSNFDQKVQPFTRYARSRPDIAMFKKDTGVFTYCEDQKEDEENTDEVSSHEETLCN